MNKRAIKFSKKYNTLNTVRLNGIKQYYSFEFLDFIMDGPM